jgi:uncharacterized membrane protein HdeD (DUF308 family)
MSEEPDERSITYDDMRHLLTWLGIGLLCVGVIQTVRAIEEMVDGHWVSGVIDGVVAVAFYVCWLRTEFRAVVYRRALRILDEEAKA